MQPVRDQQGIPIDLTGWKFRASFYPVFSCPTCEHVDWNREQGDPVPIPIRITCETNGEYSVDDENCSSPGIVEVWGTESNGTSYLLAKVRV